MISCWLIFAILGMALFAHKFGYCESVMNFHVGKQECSLMGKSWQNAYHNFDDVFNSISSLFVISTLDVWGEIMQVSYNSAGSDTGPKMFNNLPLTFVFFFLFIFVGAYFFIGLLTGILFVNFKQESKKLANSKMSTD